MTGISATVPAVSGIGRGPDDATLAGMTLYGYLGSPFVQRVLMAARVKGREIELRPPPGGDMDSPEFLAASPTRRIPILHLDGEWLCESGAIVEYLDDSVEGRSICGGSPLARARARAIAAVADCELSPGLRAQSLLHLFRLPGAAALAETGMADIVRALDAIDRMLDPERRCAVGDDIGTADVILVPLLALCRIYEPVAGTGALVDARPHVAAYYARMRTDPIARRSIDAMVTDFSENYGI